MVEAKRPLLEAALATEDAFVAVTRAMQCTEESKTPLGCAAIRAAAVGPMLREVRYFDLSAARAAIDIAADDARRKMEQVTMRAALQAQREESERRRREEGGVGSGAGRILGRSLSLKARGAAAAAAIADTPGKLVKEKVGFLRSVFTPGKAAAAPPASGGRPSTGMAEVKSSFLAKRLLRGGGSRRNRKSAYGPDGDVVFDRGMSRPEGSPAVKGAGGDWIEMSNTPRKRRKTVG